MNKKREFVPGDLSVSVESRREMTKKLRRRRKRQTERLELQPRHISIDDAFRLGLIDSESDFQDSLADGFPELSDQLLGLDD